MTPYHAAWYALSLVTFSLQLALGTDAAFALASLGIFILLPIAYGLFARLDNIGAILVIAAFTKLFIVSQWLKIAFLQPADTNLEAPLDTALALLLALIGFCAAALLLRPLLAATRLQILTPSHDPVFLGRVGVAALLLGVVASLIRQRYNVVDTLDEHVSGQGLVVWNYLSQLMPFAVAVFTARALVLSDGRRSLDPRVIVAILLSLGLGLLLNSRTDMLIGVVVWYVTYLFYGGRVAVRHIALGAAVATMLQVVIFPLIDAQRSLHSADDLSAYVEDTGALITSMATGEFWAQGQSDRLERMYETWETRLYYGTPQGMLDRFTPAQVDEVVWHTNTYGPFGIDHAFYPLTRVIPPVLLTRFGLDHPMMGNRLLQLSIWPTAVYSSPNFGVIAELFAYVGLWLLPFAVAITMAGTLWALHVLYGPVGYNFFAAYCVSMHLFVIADGELATFVSRTIEQGLVNVLLFTAAVLVWSKRRAVTAAAPAER